jgi:hypothetical protein
MIAGSQYGLSSRSGVGPGTFPAAAGFFLALSSVLWLAGLLRHQSPSSAGESKLEGALEAELGPELIHRVMDVESANEGRIELDENPLVAHAEQNDDEPVTETSRQRRLGEIRVVTVVAAIAVAAFLLPYLGFVFVMTLQLLVILIVAGRQPWLRSLLVALAAALATRYVFGELLSVPLPSSFIPVLSEWGI